MLDKNILIQIRWYDSVRSTCLGLQQKGASMNIVLGLMVSIFCFWPASAMEVKEFESTVRFVSGGKKCLNWYILHNMGISIGEEAKLEVKQAALVYESGQQAKDIPLTGGSKNVPFEDGRNRVFDTQKYPYKCFAKLNIRMGGLSYGGSAVNIGPQHALSCAHCVYDSEKKCWADELNVLPGLNEMVAPYGSIRVVKAYVPERYIRTGKPEFDIALLVLEQSVGLKTGWLGCLFTKGDSMFSEKNISVTGYPGDKGFVQLWTMAGLARALEGERILFDLKVSGGQSGGPIWLTVDSHEGKQPVVVGVVSHGEAVQGQGNAGTRLTEDTFKQFVNLINATGEIEMRPPRQPRDWAYPPNDNNSGSFNEKGRDSSPPSGKSQNDVANVSDEELMSIAIKCYGAKNYGKARASFEKIAAESADIKRKAWANTYLARIYFFGEGVVKNSQRVRACCEEVRTFAREVPELTEPREICEELSKQRSQKERNAKLFFSALGGYRELAKVLLAQEADPNSVDNDGDTPLHTVSTIGYPDIARLLIEHKAKVNARAKNGGTPLHRAAFCGYSPIVALLLNSGAIMQANDSGVTPLHNAASSGKGDIVEALIREGADVKAISDSCSSVLSFAAAGGSCKVIEALIGAGADVNTVEKNGLTPLWHAVVKGHSKAAELLIAQGADCTIIDANGVTMLHWAAANGLIEIARAIIREGLKKKVSLLWMPSKKGETPLHWAAKDGQKEMCEFLIMFVDKLIHAVDEKGFTPLHWAAHYGHVEVFKMLVEKGASVTAVSRQNITSLHLAAIKRHKEIADHCVLNGAALEAIDSKGRTALHAASIGGHRGIVDLLLARGASVSCFDEKGYTPLHHAVEQGNAEVIAALIAKGAKPHSRKANGMPTAFELAKTDEIKKLLK